MWYCPSCKEHRQAFKQIQLMKLPRYLIIQLKRFKNETTFYYGNSKNSEEVDFPLHNLNMNKYIKQCNNNNNNNTSNTSYVYDLFAISQHYGISFGGHYTAFIKHNNTWYDFDDETVRQVHSGSLVSSNAYLLFYKLKE
jgi:ubiquitin carboxyl-terminal hydrolase 4/11/15